MATTSIENISGDSTAERIQSLKSDLANGVSAGQITSVKPAAADASKGLSNAGRSTQDPPPALSPVTDVASVLLSEVATTDLTKLTRILDPAPDPNSNKVLDSLLNLAVQEVANGNGERAVGYLADYATRDPRRAEALPLQPELEPVRDKIDSMVSRMALVAKMSAEDGLSRAEQTATALAGKLSNWDTNADVLIKLAHRLFDAGGYANYSRTAELAKLVSDAAIQAKPNDQALAASAAAAAASNAMASAAASQMLPGINVPYWTSPDFPVSRPHAGRRITPGRRQKSGAVDDVRKTLGDLREIAGVALSQLWNRAPLLVLMLVYFALGVLGGVIFAIGSRIWPEGLFVVLGNLAFSMWALGFLGMVGFGFYARIKYMPRR
jgi:hypothetical protein